MAININGSNIQQLNTAAGKSLDKSQGNVKNTDSVGNAKQNISSAPTKIPTDSLTLTDSAINLKKLEESISHLPIVDINKVEEIQNKLKDGSYNINPDKIAQRFIEMEVALSQ